MANKKAILKQLADYFAEKGMMMTPSEYKEADDAPIRYMVAKRPFGSWHRMTSMLTPSLQQRLHQKQNLKRLQRQQKQLPKKLKSEVDNGENFSLD